MSLRHLGRQHWASRFLLLLGRDGSSPGLAVAEAAAGSAQAKAVRTSEAAGMTWPPNMRLGIPQ